MSYCTFKLAWADKAHGDNHSCGKYRRFLYRCGENKDNLISVKQPNRSTAPLVTLLMFDRGSGLCCLQRDLRAMLEIYVPVFSIKSSSCRWCNEVRAGLLKARGSERHHVSSKTSGYAVSCQAFSIVSK